MRLHLLGTAAAEAWPAPFCVCPSCEKARRLGGVNVRSRSGALVDDDLKIDFGPDTVSQLQRFGRHLAGVRTILLTHQHHDHVVGGELVAWADRPFTQAPPPRVDAYGNAAALDVLRPVLEKNPRANLVLHTIAAGERFTTPDGDEVHAMCADHCEGACVLRVRRKRDGKVLFYGHDSGLYPAETLDALAAGGPLDVALFDCTSGGQKTASRGHMDIDGVVRMVEELRRRGAITPTTRALATHFSHNGGLLHDELVQAFAPHQIEVAFDGMVVEV